MKTTILLDLSRTGVRLLDGGTEPPTVLGEVALGAADFDARITELRARAADGAGGVMVLIPRSEILFLDLASAGGGDDAQADAVREALEGRTPYALADLAVDWRRRADGRIAVAAVARETLDEAHDFAIAQGFTPRRYGSLADPVGFGARPDFGAPGAIRSAARPAGAAPRLARAPDTAPVAATPDAATDASPEATAGAPPDRAAAAPPRPAASGDRLGSVAARVAMLPEGRAARPARRPIAAPQTRPRAIPTPPIDHPAAPPAARPAAPASAAPHDPRLALAQRQLRRDPGAERRPVGDRPRPAPPVRGGGNSLPTVAAGLTAALALAALIWTVMLLVGPAEDEITTAPEGLAALPDDGAARTGGPDALADDITAVPGPRDAADDTVGPAPGASPADPLNRPADTLESDRYAATGVAATPPAAPVVPQSDGAAAPLDGAADPALPQPDGMISLANPLREAEETPPAPAPPASGPTPGTTMTTGTPAAADPAATGAEAETTIEASDRVEPTPDGALSATGVTVIAGPPPVVPPETPARPSSPAPASDSSRSADSTGPPAVDGAPVPRPQTRPTPDDSATDAAAAPLPDAAPIDAAATWAADRPDPVDGGAAPRPLARPGATAPAIPDAAEARVTVAPAPRPRAADPAPDATTVPVSSVVDSAAVAAAAASALDLPLADPPSPYAVARSLSPATRPQGLAPEAGRPAADAPVRVATATATPQAPISGGVASRATTPNEIALGRVNLIGVYGSSANRRALVRLPSGRFAKVQVGDRVDGGRVRAIGSGDLSYVKGGRDITLQMPGG